MSKDCWGRMKEFWSQFFHVVLILGLVAGLVIFFAGWVGDVGSRGFEEPYVVHVLATVFGVLSVVLLVYCTFSKDAWGGTCNSFLLLTILPFTYALLGATIGVNSYYMDQDCDPTSSANDENSTDFIANVTDKSCNTHAIKAQYGGAAIASFALFLHIVSIQRQYRNLQKESEGQIRMHDIQEVAG